MSVKLLLEYANFVALAFALIGLILLYRSRSMAQYKMLTAFMALDLLCEIVAIPLLFFRKALGIPLPVAASTYFYVYWSTFVIQSALVIFIVYGVFHLAMEPLKGLHRIGTLAFRWVAALAIVLSVALGLGPQLASSLSHPAIESWIAATTQIQQGVNILTICLLLFVCFSIKPLGLTFRSRIFGVSLGLGIYATVELVSAALSRITQDQSVYSPLNLMNAAGGLVAYAIWMVYFAMPEPERKMILLPTTSPYFFWNAISEALGDDPGHVVVAGFTPSVLAPAELNLLTEQADLNAARAQSGSAPELEAAPRRRRRQLATAS